MNKGQNENYNSIDMFELIKVVWQHKTIVISFLIVGVLFSLINSIFFTANTYTANGTIYVSSESSTRPSNNDFVDVNDIYTARILSSTYIETLYLRSFLSDVSDDLGGKYTWEEINQMVSISIVNETELLSVSATAYSPQDAYMITSSILRLAPGKLTDVAKGGSIKIIDDVVMPIEPNGNGTIAKAILMGILAIAAAVGFIMLTMFLDNKIHKSEDIEKRYGVSILGVLNN